ncbi:unnamed protein product [Lactuca saligna]|uniref:Alcohol dehydrogenase-like C-terminal domain-containing protein n=1 Tax=Lactuca saligna TaxID=75948 RepID=A0AA35ZYP6_LACSI|nr:unnamed protein product [Lactuca saligna]
MRTAFEDHSCFELLHHRKQYTGGASSALKATGVGQNQWGIVFLAFAIARKSQESLVIEEVIVVAPKPREVRIKIICTSLWHSDINYWKLERPPVIFPRILGHEAIGDETRKFTDMNGETLYHFLHVSCFTEYTVVEVARVIKVDPTILTNIACLLSCGVSIGVGVAWKAANVEIGTTVAIFGLGAVGLAVADGASLCGVKRIIVVDLNQDKFEIDYCFECVGLTSLVHEAYAACRKGWGKTVMLGVDQPEAMLILSSLR